LSPEVTVSSPMSVIRTPLAAAVATAGIAGAAATGSWASSGAPRCRLASSFSSTTNKGARRGVVGASFVAG